MAWQGLVKGCARLNCLRGECRERVERNWILEHALPCQLTAGQGLRNCPEVRVHCNTLGVFLLFAIN